MVSMTEKQSPGKTKVMMVMLILMMMTSLLMTACQAASIPEDASSANRTLTIGLLGAFSYHWYLGTQDATAIIPAIDDIIESGLLPGYQIKWIWREDNCNPQLGFRMAIDIWQSVEDLDVIIGASCSSVCEPVSLLAATWNIPVISPGCTSPALSDKRTYPTFARVVGPENMLAPLINAILDELDWDRCAIVTSPQDLFAGAAKEIKRVVGATGKKVYYHVINPVMEGDEVNEEAMKAQAEIIRMLHQEARFVILMMVANEIRHVMVTAYDEGMLNGDYIFLGNEVLAYIRDYTYRSELTNDVLFEGFLSVEPQNPSGQAWDLLAEEVVQAFVDPHFDGYNDELISPANFYAATLYEAVMLWAHGVNRTLEDGGAADDGLDITNHILNYTFDGISGPVAIDHQGDRKITRILSIMQPGWQVVDLFIWQAYKGELERVYVSESGEEDWSGLFWGGGSTTIPTGIPQCGWGEELCQPSALNQLAPFLGIIPAAIAVIFGSVLAVCIYKQQLRRQEEEEVKKLFVDIADITLFQNERAPSVDIYDTDMSIGGITPLPSMSVEAVQEKLDSEETVLGMVKDQEVIMHGFNTMATSAYITDLMEEVREMKNISHDNVNRFVAVCVTSSNITIMMSWASRGSLRDLIADPNVVLFWDMKISLMADIARGLRYLHKQSDTYHGRLTSSNCVVDKRWVCQLTDYGFKSLRSAKDRENPNLTEASLWKAPEILRQESALLHRGDIYAFGIILQELLTESYPFAHNKPELNLAETIERVKAGKLPLYRPDIPPPCPEACRSLAECCWAEDPEARPSCSGILKGIARINGGEIPQFVDRIIQNLASHTRKLEEVVKKRSIGLRTEKATMSAILSELLPLNVCEQLKRGNQVEPEHYDCVTVCFTDLVGFTQAAARLVPLEVVKILNCLYHRFDDVISCYDVYKVATIGDAYVVASGVPLRNDDAHAEQIARMSIQLIHAMANASDSSMNLQMRVGINTGPCVAGVTGIKTPRYLLFGETIDMAARIEAGGEPMKIHISDTTASLLEDYEDFEIVPRGLMKIKGIGSISTSWLLVPVERNESLTSPETVPDM